MIETADFNTLILNAFIGKTTWLWASQQYTLDEFIDVFHRTRIAMQKTVDGLTDGQAAFHMEGVSTWSLSETITHLIYSQGFYLNALLDIIDPRIPHITEAARGFGEGGRPNVPADELRAMLYAATLLINEAIEKTRAAYDPKYSTHNRFFGEVTYATWILLLSAHEVDHVRQSIVMRRYARIGVPGSATQMQTINAVSLPEPELQRPSPVADESSKQAEEKAVNADSALKSPVDHGAINTQEAGSDKVVTR